MKTNIQIFFDKGLFDIYDNADEVLKDHLFTGVKDRRRPSLGESNS